MKLVICLRLTNEINCVYLAAHNFGDNFGFFSLIQADIGQYLTCLHTVILTNNNIQELGDLEPLSSLPKLEYLRYVHKSKYWIRSPNWIQAKPRKSKISIRYVTYFMTLNAYAVMCLIPSFFHSDVFSLMGNPVTHKPQYRFYVIFKLPHVRVLDYRRIKQSVK